VSNRGLVLLSVVGSAVLATAGALWLAATWLVERMTAPSRPADETRGFTPFETGVRWESIAITAEDGSPMAGWLLLGSDAAPAILACGGYRGRRSDLLGISSALWRAGFNVLLFDYRGHGDRSATEAPAPVTLGYRELADARAALDVVRDRFPGSPLGVIGYSMGAAVALMVAAREADVRAIVADSPFTSLREIVRYRLGRAAGRLASSWTQPLGAWIVALADRRLHSGFHFHFSDVDPLRDASALTQPLLLVHGLDDREVPPEHSRHIAAAAERAGIPLESWFVPGASHCQAYFLDRPVYCARVTEFFQRHLGAHGPDGPA
jgi:dipeptidyl aminopeptidase/acylaminoacyl peptidase